MHHPTDGVLMQKVEVRGFFFFDFLLYAGGSECEKARGNEKHGARRAWFCTTRRLMHLGLFAILVHFQRERAMKGTSTAISFTGHQHMPKTKEEAR
jgi:hypothetical protein